MHGFEERGIDVPRGRFVDTGRFGRMFPELRSLKKMTPEASVLGAIGGPMDAGAGGGPDNDRIKAGYTFLGQFIDHDLTLDAVSILEQQIDLSATTNFRTPAFELDSLYGRGPDANPTLYDKTQPRGTFLVEGNSLDLPRNSQGRAIIGDHRNDENRIIGQLHVLFLKFHNKVLADTVASGDIGEAASAFEAAQTVVRWHYQWIVLHEFLPRIVGKEMVDALIDGIDRFHVGPAYMPVEFSGAAYRFGHSQVRERYPTSGGAKLIFPDLGGGSALPADQLIDWARFFGDAAIPSKLIDTKLAAPLLSLPDGVVPPGTPTTDRSLAVRNLKRGLDLRLPAGQTIADFQTIPKLTDAELWANVPGGAGPGALWYYVLREAEVFHQAKHLGGVGAFIVAKTFVNLLLADKASFLWQFPNWRPSLPSETAGKFTMADLANYTLGTAIGNETITFESVGPAAVPESNIAAQREATAA